MNYLGCTYNTIRFLLRDWEMLALLPYHITIFLDATANL